LLGQQEYDVLVATGYGRYLAKTRLRCPVVTEIKAYAKGAEFTFPGCRTILDIGGQDSKIIRVNTGKVEDFEMNDRCAAGTGKFLEVMATTLGYTIDEFGTEALKANSTATINSMCTVFSESEVVSLIARGENPQSIACGVHQSIVNRIISLMGRVGFEEPIVFGGGVAKNDCMISLLAQRLACELLVSEEPQIIGAIGAALVAGKKN
jgi:predicted CoA-substrate-specific enzyme activase